MGFYRDTVHIDILDNFDRLSIEVYDYSRNHLNILNSEDIILYNEIASIIEFDKIDYLNDNYNVYRQTFNVKVKKASNTSPHSSYLIDGIEKKSPIFIAFSSWIDVFFLLFNIFGWDSDANKVVPRAIPIIPSGSCINLSA